MIFTPLALDGAFLVELERQADARGFFARTFCAEEFASHGLVDRFVQTSLSHNARRGVLRGLHFQTAPHTETKLVRCAAGAIFDVLVDLRPNSPSYRRWTGLELSAGDGRMVYAPEGLAHGFLTLKDETEVEYQITPAYAPSAATGVRWNDPAFAIDWPEAPELHVSERDAAWPLMGS